ncbi:hypothetical protein GGR79_003970 [Xanthomonas arboricola]|nr:hypothetical protein [Xanthomonas arboricola]
MKQIKNKRELKLAERWEHKTASPMAKGKHPFRVIKHQFGYVNVHYHGLAKSIAYVLTFLRVESVAWAQTINACRRERAPITRAVPLKW